MTIAAIEKVKFFPATTEEFIGNALFNRSLMHAAQTLGHAGLGLSYQSCNAAVAVDIGGPYEHVNVAGQNFAIVFGSSRLYQGLDPSLNAIHMHISPTRPFSSSANEEHAEQTAIRVATAVGENFFQYGNHNHIYIDLTPCPSCHAWLQQRPESWYVHYFSELNDQAPIIAEKKKFRVKLFGRQMEKRKGPVGGITKSSKTKRLRRR